MFSNARPAARRSRSRSTRARGFTLIELTVVLFIVVLLVGIAIPAIGTVTGLKAKSELGKLMANLRATRGHSAVAGETCRFVFDIDGAGYSVECAKGAQTIVTETMRGGGVEEKKKEDKAEKDMTEAEKVKKKILERVKFASVPTVPPQKLAGGIYIESVWTAHQEDKYTKGKAYLYFFPSGTTEMADIVLKEGEDYYTVQVAPMTGHVQLLSKKVDKSKDDGSDFF